MCNKFLILGFGCVQEGILGFQRKIVFSYFGWECLFMTTMERRKRNEVDVVMFMALMFLCRFLLVGMSELLWIILDTG